MYNPSFRTNRNSVPILSKKDIEAIGRNFIMDFCPDALVHPQTIDIEGFIECYLKMKLDYQYLSNDGRYLGMTVSKPESAFQSDGRRNKPADRRAHPQRAERQGDGTSHPDAPEKPNGSS